VSRPTLADPRVALTVVVACVMALGLTLAWAFLSMRVVMDVGGACADGGPYVSAQPCPGGAGFIGLAIPVMLLAAFLGSFAAASQSAPNLLVPMWAALFLSLGWNFLEYGVTASPDGWVWSWIICGVVFVLMGAPALFFLRAAPGSRTGTQADVRWWPVYAVAATIGVVLGVLSFRAFT
jgi:hypothetical protein